MIPHPYIPNSLRTGAHTAYYLIRDNSSVPAFQAWADAPFQLLSPIAHLDAPPCLPAGHVIDVAGPAVALALWFRR